MSHAAPVGFCAAGSEHDGADASGEGFLEGVGCDAMLVDRHRDDHQTESGEEVEDRGVPGILYAHPVCRAQPCAERTLHTIERTTHHAEMARVDALGRELPGPPAARGGA